MSVLVLPLAAEPAAMTRTPEPARLLEKLTALRQENAALLAVRVTEYQMVGRRCAACGKRTRAELPAGVPRRSVGVRLTAVIALLSGRYRLSRREVRQLLRDPWQVHVSLDAVVRQEQAQS